MSISRLTEFGGAVAENMFLYQAGCGMESSISGGGTKQFLPEASRYILRLRKAVPHEIFSGSLCK